MYPVVATQWNNRAQEQVAKDYEALLHDQPEPQLNTEIEAARAYNENQKDGPILDPWLARVSKDKIVIPSIEARLPVYHGTAEDTLQKGLGHLFGTALPVGGVGSHSVITGHTGIPTATLFDNLSDIKVGDAIYVSTFGERMKYKVYDIEVVLPDETDSLRADPERDLLTLITCTPYGINTHRLLVHAERVPMDPDEASVLDESTSTLQWWMWALGGVSLLILLALIWWIIREKKNSDRKDAMIEEALS